MRRALTATLVAAGLAAIPLVSGPAVADGRPNPTPIPNQPGAVAPAFLGGPAIQRPVFRPAIPGNPNMSTNPWSAIHDDTYMSDTYTTAGPLGRSPAVSSTWLGDPAMTTALVVGLTFDRDGRMVAAAIKNDTATGTAFVRMTLIDPDSLATLATYDLPGEPFTGTFFRPAGTYFYSDQDDRTVVGTADRTIQVISHTATAFTLDRTYDLTKAIPAGDAIEALQPDFSGYIWFTTKGGVVGTVDTSSGKVRGTYKLGKKEQILNSTSADSDGGVYLASDRAMYRFDATKKGKPAVTWRRTYDEGDRIKPGQVGLGTGTTPTVMGSKYVAITDNADPRMHVLVYQRAKKVSGSRLVCSVPVFQPGTSATENSLVGTDKSIVVENNYGYVDPSTTTGGQTTTPGITRIDISSKGKCTTKWTNDTVSIPSLVTKMSLGNGLIYTYTKPQGPGTTDAWYLTALDFRSGRVVFSQLAGTGPLYNNHYSALFLGPNGAAYVGVMGGIVAIHDTH